jgi:hypothetical protein
MDTDGAPQIKYSFIPLDQIEALPKDSTCGQSNVGITAAGLLTFFVRRHCYCT